MNELQKSLISVGASIIVLILVYLSIHYYLKSLKKMKKHKMLTLNLVIKYKLFLEYLAYQENQKQNYYLILVKINNLNEVEQTYNDNIVRSYLTKIAKELSIYLPFGGKIAQAPQRDTFIMYYPVLEEDGKNLGKQLKLLAQKSYHENGTHITKANSIAMIDRPNIKSLSYALIDSIRNLGEVVVFDESKHHSSEEFISLSDKLKLATYTLKSYQVEAVKINRIKEVYNEFLIQDMNLFTFLNKIAVIDQSWVNMYMVESILNRLYQKNIYANISLPFLLRTIEHEIFIEYLDLIVKANQFLLENVILSVKLTSVEQEDQLIKNILTLSNLGLKVSLQLDDINQNIYNAIQRYHVKRIEIDNQLIKHELIADLLYFAKVNHIEVLYKAENQQVDQQNLQVTHIRKDLMIFDTDKQKRGRR